MRFILLFAVLLSHVAYAQEELSAKAWLDNMSQALRDKQFKYSLVQLQADHIRPLIYLHGLVDGQGVAFLEHLNGPPKNAVRVGDTVTFIEHDQPAYSVHTNRIPGVFPAAFAGNIDELAKGYQFVLGGRSRIAGRPGQMIRIIPQEDDRYSYQVWLDMDSFLPLRYDMLSQQRQLIEQILAIELVVLKSPPELLIEAEKQEWPPVVQQEKRHDGQNWQFKWLPEGFKVMTRDHHKLISTGNAVEYIALSDGIANISVYVARAGSTPLPSELMTRNGLSMVSERVGNAEVVAVGRVPAVTLTKLAKSLTLK
ncbi:MucB/RseB C-terminal domain-containing protein [Shewanella marina]|uniref:MucB/RseB C-terminal domain-containing protein n=1 Tax=Shewanella marina TaxID=487319 RepID=UPI00046FE43D|nr:MucB/RseB C-terminal domain-containing protein [Shewanella marina]